MWERFNVLIHKFNSKTALVFDRDTHKNYFVDIEKETVREIDEKEYDKINHWATKPYRRLTDGLYMTEKIKSWTEKFILNN